MNRKLLIATHNPGKMREFLALLAPLEAELAFPTELGLELAVAEDGATYVDNAGQKARAYALASGMLTLADDSGLEVDALDGAPGILSARYTPGQDKDRVAALLAALEGVPVERRGARFHCAVVIEAPSGRRHVTKGVCEGMIALAPSGTGGFGYDPVFHLPQYACTMAQLPEALKNKISHRARAIEAALPYLRRILSADVPTDH